jgi:hypothetical protein
MEDTIMSHINEKNLRAVLDRIVSQPKLGPAMRSIGADEKLIFMWLRKSAAGDPKFLVAWPDPDGEPQQFVELVKLARKMHLIKLDAAIREDVERGTPRTVIQDGKVCWVEDEALSKYTDQMITDMYELEHFQG